MKKNKLKISDEKRPPNPVPPIHKKRMTHIPMASFSSEVKEYAKFIKITAYIGYFVSKGTETFTLTDKKVIRIKKNTRGAIMRAMKAAQKK